MKRAKARAMALEEWINSVREGLERYSISNQGLAFGNASLKLFNSLQIAETGTSGAGKAIEFGLKKFYRVSRDPNKTVFFLARAPKTIFEIMTETDPEFIRAVTQRRGDCRDALKNLNELISILERPTFDFLNEQDFHEMNPDRLRASLASKSLSKEIRVNNFFQTMSHDLAIANLGIQQQRLAVQALMPSEDFLKTLKLAKQYLELTQKMVSVRRGKSRNKITNEKWKVQRVSDELSLLTKIIYGQPKIELVQAIVGSEVIKETLGQTLHEQKLKERKKKLKSEAPVILTDFGL